MKSLKLKALMLAAGLVAASLSTTASATPTIVSQSNGFTFYGTFNGSLDEYISLPTFNNLIGTLSGSVIYEPVSNSIAFTAFDIVNATTHATVIAGSIFSGGYASFGYLVGSSLPQSYALHVTGTSVSDAKYSGEVTVTSAVPEPETYGMMLAGLGLMGFVARRRKSV